MSGTVASGVSPAPTDNKPDAATAAPATQPTGTEAAPATATPASSTPTSTKPGAATQTPQKAGAPQKPVAANGTNGATPPTSANPAAKGGILSGEPMTLEQRKEFLGQIFNLLGSLPPPFGDIFKKFSAALGLKNDKPAAGTDGTPAAPGTTTAAPQKPAESLQHTQLTNEISEELQKNPTVDGLKEALGKVADHVYGVDSLQSLLARASIDDAVAAANKDGKLTPEDLNGLVKALEDGAARARVFDKPLEIIQTPSSPQKAVPIEIKPIDPSTLRVAMPQPIKMTVDPGPQPDGHSADKMSEIPDLGGERPATLAGLFGNRAVGAGDVLRQGNDSPDVALAKQMQSDFDQNSITRSANASMSIKV